MVAPTLGSYPGAVGVELEFIKDARVFLDKAGDYLAQAPVLNTVVATVAEQTRRGEQTPAEDDWWLVVRCGAAIVGVGMRTAHFEPRPAYLLPLPDDAARSLAHVLHGRGEILRGVNGALPAVQLCAQECARLSGQHVTVQMRMRLFELAQVIPPPPVPGALRPATADDLELAHSWFEAFMADADEQAGRAPGVVSAHEVPDRDGLLRRIVANRIWLWTNEAGRTVHLTAVSPPSFGAVRLGPVYTPPHERGRGYASATVAAVSAQVLDSGATPCLFTDQANPTSNAIYQRLGYRPIVDMANLTVQPTHDAGMPGA